MRESITILAFIAAIILLTGNAGDAQPRFDCLIGVNGACEALAKQDAQP